MTKLENQYLSFDITSSEVIEENPDSRFITVRMHVFSSGLNLHGFSCSEETLRKTAPSLYNTPIIYNVDTRRNDFGTHVEPEDSLICGFCIPNSETFERLEDGRLGLFILARISKMYCPDVVDILKNRDGNVRVSVEMMLHEAEERESGEKEMLSFTYYSTCLLGKIYREASPLAHLEVISFSESNKKIKEEYLEEFSDKYSDIDFTIPEAIKHSAQKSLDYYKQNGGNANSAHLAMARYLIKNEKITHEKVRLMSTFFNRKVQYDSITKGFYGGKDGAEWSSGVMSKIDEIDNKIMSYFGEFITFPYSKISDAPENMKKLDGVALTLEQINQIAEVADSIGSDKKKNGWAIAKSQFKKSHFIKDDKWVKKEAKEEMSVRVIITNANKEAEIKFSLTSSQIMEILNNFLSKFKYGEDQWKRYWAYNFDSEHVYFHDNEESKDFRAKYSIAKLVATVDVENKEEVIEGCPVPVEVTEYMPEFAEKDPDNDNAGGGDTTGQGDEVDTDKDDGKDKTTMSLDSNLDLAALMAMLADETEDYKALVAKHEAGEEMDYAMLCSKMFCKMQTMAEDAKKAQEDKDVYMAENAKLQEYKAGIEKKQFDSTVEYTLQEVSESLPKEEIEKAREQSKEFTLDNVSAWANDLKSLAFSYIKDNPKKKESFVRIATNYSWLPNSSETEDVNEKYAKNGWV